MIFRPNFHITFKKTIDKSTKKS
uniref:Uncharacterized protein n=1 Tax=Rhizophora mucronata TaxID=61149 RepID=A0A2P2IQX4_RHIMU